jgi:transcriptional regulator GlxA family with amidase domain
MDIAIPLFDRFTALDAIGPYETLSRLPDARVTFLAAEPGPVASDNRMLKIVAERALDDLPEPDIVVVPGGIGTRAMMNDAELIAWVRRAHKSTDWTCSVCTGSLVLGAAGLLDGLEATTHWMAMDTLASTGARPTGRRVVVQGKIITAAGVSSGIDMGLTLAAKIAGDTVAQAIQLGIEYDPQPPFDAGSPEKAPDEVVALCRGVEALIDAAGPVAADAAS